MYTYISISSISTNCTVARGSTINSCVYLAISLCSFEAMKCISGVPIVSSMIGNGAI